MSDTPNKHVYRVDDIEVDLLSGSLRRNGDTLFLREQTLQVFTYLVAHRAETITKEDLIKNVWQGTAVTDDALVQCIVEIRKALGDDSRRPKFVKTVPKVGYRFIAPVEKLGVTASMSIETEEVTSVQIEEEEVIDEEPSTKSRLFRRISVTSQVVLATGLILLLAALGVFLYQRSQNNTRELSTLNLASTGKQPVAVMFFEDRSGSDELNWLREGLPDMLISDLSRSPRLAVLSRQQLHLLLERIGNKKEGAISLEEALEVAQKTQADVLITGSFTKIGERIRVEVQLLDAPGGQLITSEHFVVENPTEILTQMDLLSLRLKRQLGVTSPPDDVRASLADLMTSNLEAYRYYSQALEKAQGLHNTEAIQLLEKAVALDPGFAMAHARIGYAYAVTWNFAEKARPHFEKAFRLSERLNEKDKLNITGWYAIANLDYETAIGVFRKMIAEYPMEIEAYFRLGRLLQGEERFEEALEITRQGLILDPEAKELYNLRGGLYLALKRYDEAIAAYQSYIAFAPDEPNALDSLGLGYQATGRYQEAADAYRRALLLKPDFEVAVIHLGNLYFQQGRYREAIEQYQKYIQTTAEASERARGYESIAYVYLRGKNTAKAVAAANRAVELEKSAVRSSLVIALERGQVDLAESLRRKVFNQGQYTYRGARPPKREHHFYEGLIAIKRGQSDDAVKAFKEALIYQPLIWSVDSYEDCLGRAYLDLGQVDQAIAEFERVLKENPQYPLAHYHLAQAYERKGEREQGRQLYEQFLQVWKDADHYVPEVVIARQRLSGS